MAEEAEAAPDAAEARASPETQATAEPTALLVMQCAGCQLANEVSIPIGDQRVFAVQCCGCDALNEITIDTNGGPLVCSEGKAEWNKHVREVSASATADSVPADDPSPSPAAEAEESAASSVPLKKRQKLSTPKAEELAPTAASDSAAPKPMVVKLGSAVIAKFNDGYYYHGIVEDMQGSSRFFIAWDDGDPTSWVTARHTALFYRPACPSEVSVGMPVLALWRGITKVEGDDEEESDVFFPAKVMSRLPDGNFALKWLDGGENFRTGAEELRTFLSFSPSVRVAPDEKEEEEPTRKKLLQQQKEQDQKERRPTPPKPPPKVSRSQPEGPPGRSGFAADLVRRSGRGGAASEGRSSGADPSDTRLLSQAMAELQRCWAGVSPQGAWKVSQDVGGVPGLAVCADFLSAAEVEALRTLIGAHRTWEQYTYGSTGRHGELASVVQRIDFGPAEAAPEGAVGGAPMWRLGHERAELLQLVGDRLRHVFASSRLWVDTQPDTVQFTKIGVNSKIANHFDRRDKWLEGIASIAWSELPCEGDLRGEAWSLCMQIGSGKEKRSVRVPMQPGSAYVLMGAAQGVTRVCKRKCVGHSACGCCWTHGVDMEVGASVTRHSMTLRVLAEDDEDSSDEDGDEEGEGEDGEAVAAAAAEGKGEGGGVKQEAGGDAKLEPGTEAKA